MKTMSHLKHKKNSFLIATRFMGLIIGGIVMAGLFAFIFGYFVMLLWNWLMPEIFGLTTINYWQAFGIIVLAKLIFGIFGHKDHHKPDDNKGKDFFRNWVHNGITPWKHHRQQKKENFNKWRYYDDFWQEEGEETFRKYVEKKENTNETK